MNPPYKLIALGVLLFTVILAVTMTAGVNSAGYRTVVQWPNGNLFVKFEPGLYFKFFGSATEYPDVVTFDFDRQGKVCGPVDVVATGNFDEKGEPIYREEPDASDGVTVRYQDGGIGTICGQGRFALPGNEDAMLAIHKEFRSTDGILSRLFQPTTVERINLTAGLMSSEEAYTVKRGEFAEWARDQIQNGKYKTTLQEKVAKDESLGTDEVVMKEFPVIEYKDGLPIYLSNDFKPYGIRLSGFQITDWGFEARTVQQIAAKRKATMAIITAKAEAERAKQDAITAEAEGEKNVTVAKFEKEVEKQRAVVVAQQQKEVAEIAAAQKVAVAEQAKLEQEQNKFAMAEYKQAETLRGEGDAAYKRAVIEADNALAQKLATYETVMGKFAEEFGKQKWVPEVMFNNGQGGTTEGSNAASQLIEMLSVKTAKDLAVDLNVNRTP